MPILNTKILTDLVADDPVQLDASYSPSNRDRRYIDDQIIATQGLLSDAVLSGVLGTWPRLSSNSAALEQGDWVCITDSTDPEGIPVVTKAVLAAVSEAGKVFGVCTESVQPGSRFSVSPGV